MIRDLQRLLAPLKRRVQLMLSRGEARIVDDGPGLQRMQVSILADETMDGVERFQQFGFTSVPLSGAEVIAASLGGNRSHTVIIAVDDRRYRKRGLAPGEAAMHNHLGDYIVIRQDRSLEVFAGAKVKVTAPEVEVVASSQVTLTTPLVQCSQDVQVVGNLTVGGAATVAGAIVGSGGFAVSGGTGASVTGNLAITGGDVTVNGLGLELHKHADAQGGLTGPPQ